jgi:tetratricopeptide (TPR) repeat protein
MAMYRRAIEITPENDRPIVALSHFRLGLLLKYEALNGKDPRHAELQPAIDEVEKCLKIATDFAEGHNELGRLYDLIGRYPAAIEQFDLAIKFHKNYAEAFSNRGVAFWHDGNWDNALRDCLRATELDNQFAGGHYNFAEVLFYPAELNGTWRITVEGSPENHAAVASVMGEYSRALARKPKDLTATAATYHGEVVKAIDEYRQAVALFKQAAPSRPHTLGVDPDYVQAGLGLARAEYAYHDYDKAEEAWKAVQKLEKDNQEAKAGLAQIKKDRAFLKEHLPKPTPTAEGR